MKKINFCTMIGADGKQYAIIFHCKKAVARIYSRHELEKMNFKQIEYFTNNTGVSPIKKYLSKNGYEWVMTKKPKSGDYLLDGFDFILPDPYASYMEKPFLY